LELLGSNISGRGGAAVLTPDHREFWQKEYSSQVKYLRAVSPEAASVSQRFSMVGTGPVHLIWRTYRPSWYRKEPPPCHRAILVRRMIGADGKPRLVEVGYVSAYDESRKDDPKMIREFWWRARRQIGRLGLRGNQITQVEQALAARVPRPDESYETKPGAAANAGR
jgi:hypothetical protein